MREAKKNRKNYREVKLDGASIDRFYKNPLTKTFQYEYALYQAVANLFASVTCRSMCVESLKLYFRELPHASEHAKRIEDAGEGEKKHLTQEGLLAQMNKMVARDVAGNVTFPMMQICRAEARAVAKADGTHSFIFSDGIYGFIVSLEPAVKGEQRRIRTQTVLSA